MQLKDKVLNKEIVDLNQQSLVYLQIKMNLPMQTIALADEK